MNIGIYIYKNAEVLDFSGPFEVFSTANRLWNSKNRFNIFFVAQKSSTVCARGNYNINPHYGFDNHPLIDVLVVVGGIHSQELTKFEVIDWITRVASEAFLVTSVCTGAFLLAEAGLLVNKTVTTHWEDIDDLRKAYPSLHVVGGRRWVDEGEIITSGGISAGIDMSLHMVSRLVNVELAEQTAKQMAFDWSKDAPK